MDSILLENLIEQAKKYYPQEPITKPYIHAPDGIYDSSKDSCRYFIYEGFAYYVITRMWIENDKRNVDLDSWMKQPWGFYPDVPPKPPKR